MHPGPEVMLSALALVILTALAGNPLGMLSTPSLSPAGVAVEQEKFSGRGGRYLQRIPRKTLRSTSHTLLARNDGLVRPGELPKLADDLRQEDEEVRRRRQEELSEDPYLHAVRESDARIADLERRISELKRTLMHRADQDRRIKAATQQLEKLEYARVLAPTSRRDLEPDIEEAQAAVRAAREQAFEDARRQFVADSEELRDALQAERARNSALRRQVRHK